tara:strand:+ start:626 stop:1018 length:393 start_codon:yes stop_codon:yes gene_type:complete
MSIIECLCYSKRNDKKEKFKEKLNKANKAYHDMMNDISSPKLLPDGSYMKTSCSNLLCTKIGEKPLKKQAVCKDKIHYFCSNECWSEWLENPNIYNNIYNNNNISPMTQPNSPEYKRHSIDIDKIPPLFI